jgi:hypothetical protein
LSDEISIQFTRFSAFYSPLIATFAGYLVWVGAACVALSALLARRTEAAAQLSLF